MREMVSRRNSVDRIDATDYKDWMTGWCVEPLAVNPKDGGCTPIDSGTCFTGFFFPCKLYGKTHWRLRRLPKGENDQDKAWKEGYACNTACWVWFLLPLCSGIFTAFQRSQIRGTYGIDGSTEKDCLLGIFCTSCTQMQNDREIRAREGMIELRTSKEFQIWAAQHDPIFQQPGLQKPMKYAPPHAEGSSARVGTLPSASTAQKPASVGKSGPIRATGTGEQAGKSKFYLQVGARKTTIGTENTKNPTPAKQSSGSRKKPSKVRCDLGASQEEAKHKKGMSLIGSYKAKALFHRHQNIPNVVVTQPEPEIFEMQARTPQDATLGSIKITRNPAGQGKRKGKNVPKTPSNSASYVTQGERRTMSHSLDDCPIVEYVRRSTVTQHTLDADETTPSSSKGREAHSSSETPGLSYVHDFTDCPINKAVLEHYEREEKKAQEHAINKGSQKHVVPRTTGPPLEHNLDDCTCSSSETSQPGAENVIKTHHLSSCAPTVGFLHTGNEGSKDYKEHHLSTCSVLPVGSVSKANTPLEREHDLDSCSDTETKWKIKPEQEKSDQVKEHSFDSCSETSPAPSKTEEYTTEVREHRLESCGSLLETPPNEALPEHRLASCTPLVGVAPEIPEHPLVSCKSVVVVPPHLQEHPLDSCATLVDATPEIREHRLDSCSTVGSEPQEGPKATNENTRIEETSSKRFQINTPESALNASQSQVSQSSGRHAGAQILDTSINNLLQAMSSPSRDPTVMASAPPFREATFRTERNPYSNPDTMPGAQNPSDNTFSKANTTYSNNSRIMHLEPNTGNNQFQATSTQNNNPKTMAAQSSSNDQLQVPNIPEAKFNPFSEQQYQSQGLYDPHNNSVKEYKQPKQKRHQKRHQKTLENMTVGSESTFTQNTGLVAQYTLEQVLAAQQDLEREIEQTIKTVKHQNEQTIPGRSSAEKPRQDIGIQVPSGSEASTVAPERALQGNAGNRRENIRSTESATSEARRSRSFWGKMKAGSSREMGPR